MSASEQNGMGSFVDRLCIRSNDGVEHKFDVLICGTGFNITNKPRFEIKGRDGYQFDDKWAASPTGYLSICLASMPNYFREFFYS